MNKNKLKRINILTNLPDELLQTKECKLKQSLMNSTSQTAWRSLDYTDKHRINTVDIFIARNDDGTYFTLIKVFISGTCYDYAKAPKGSAYPHVDIAYQIANYLKILGLHVYDR